MDTSKTKKLLWNDMFLLGYEPIDKTHLEFVTVVSNLQGAIEQDLVHRLNDVLEHLESHFQQEDRWMRSTNYPALKCHIDEHAAVLKSGQDVKLALQAGDVGLCRHFANELAVWFPGHADYLDAPLAQWLTHKRFGGVPVVLKRGAGGLKFKRNMC